MEEGVGHFPEIAPCQLEILHVNDVLHHPRRAEMGRASTVRLDDGVVPESFERDDRAPGPQDPSELGVRTRKIEVMQDSGDAGEVEGIVWEGHSLRVHDLEASSAGDPELARLAGAVLDRDG